VSLRTLPAFALILAAGIFCSSRAPAQVPALAARIDRIIQERLDRAKIPASPPADDAEFLRRVYLDLTGRIPTYEQATAYLDSKDPSKRAKLIDDLLGRPEYGLHFATIWRDLIVDRTAENSQARQQYSWDLIVWMAEGFNKGRGWNEIVADLITAEGEARTNPATTFLLANRMNNFPRPADLVGSMGRLFLGMQLRCSQCHDHPYVQEWKQDDFWGLAAFFSQVRDHAMAPDGTSPKPAFFDRPNPDAKKETSYVNRLKRAGLLPPLDGARIGVPHLSDPNQAVRVVEAKFFLADRPQTMGEGAYRRTLADWLTAKDNPYFARAAVNRLWAHFFARGLLPVDDIRPGQAPAQPELLELLEKEFKASGFSHKHLIRCICNSAAYQRTSRPLPANAEDRELCSHMAIKLLTPDQTIDSLAVALGRKPTEGKNRDQQTLPFVTKEADADPTEFSHGIPQFLLQLNGGTTNAMPGSMGKLTNGKKKEDAVTALYLSALSRTPSPRELQRAVAYIDRAANPGQGYRDLYWALLNSAEFLFNR
jgi:hypothetical protein